MFDGPGNFPSESPIPTWLANDTGLSPDTPLASVGGRRAVTARSDAVRALVDRRATDPLDAAVRGVPLFSGLSKKRRRYVTGAVTRLEIPQRTVLATEGSRPREFFVVLGGEVEVRQNDDVIGTQGPGSHAGALFLLSNRRRATSLVAATPVQTLVVGHRDFAKLLEDVPELAERLHAEIGRAAVSGVPEQHAA